MTGHVLITGSGSGIGLALARAFLEAGWFVTGIDLQPAAFAAEGYTHLSCDITDEAAMAGAFDDAMTRAPLKAVVANAAVTDLAHRRIIEQDYLTWRKVLDVNVNGAFITARAAARRFVEARAGNIIFVTSSLAFFDQAKVDDAPYCASKAAVEMLMRVLALELAPTGVNVNTLFPSTRIDTGFFAALGAAERAELDPPTILNAPALFLADLAPRTLTGHSLDQRRWSESATYRAELGGRE